MNEPVIREAKLDDRVALDELFREELRYNMNLMPKMFRMPDTVVSEAWLESIIEDGDIFLTVAECSGTIVGAILYRIREGPDDVILRKRRFGYVEEMIVEESSRGKGIGKALMDHAIERLKTIDIVEIELDVWDKNDLGLRFYEKNGFSTIQRRMRRII